MRRDLQGLRVVLTGASGGLGGALAHRLAERGARLLLTGRSEDKLADVVSDVSQYNNREVRAVAADVTCEADRRRVFEAVHQHLGGLDVLINNAGVGSFAHFADSSEEILRQIMEVNFFAPAELIRMAIPHLMEGRQPAIVNVSSMCGRRGMPAWSEYSASKFALCGLTEALRGELARFDIDILLIVPGLTRTDLGNNLLRHTGRMKIDFTEGMPAEDVAQTILRSLENNTTETIVGRDARWLLRANRLFPRLLNRIIARRVRGLYQTRG